MSLTVRPLDRAHAAREVPLVAERMRLTLEEVLGTVRGGTLYDRPWLEDRVWQHLDGRLAGEVLLACLADDIVGHTIVRAEPYAGGRIGLFSTTWVAPAARRRGVASALLAAGEGWMQDRALTEAHTWTATNNSGLRTLYEGRGYVVTDTTEEMVRLARALPPVAGWTTRSRR